MSKNIELTLACGDYEIRGALKDGAVPPDGIELTIITDMDSSTRHWRFLRNREFEVAEWSSSSYIAGARHRARLRRHSGVSAPALPARLRLRQYA